MKYSLGIDLGTTGVKALLVGTDGVIKSVGYAKYPLYTPQVQHAEQDPQEWWQGMCSAITQALKSSQIDPKDILGIGFSGQMHGTVLLDKDGNVLCPAIIHCDQRAYREKQEILDKTGIEKLGSFVQNQVHSGFQATSLLWVRNNRPDIYEKIHSVLLPKDYLRYLLTGEIASEITDAASTLLFDNSRRTWSDELLRTLDIPRSILPDPCHAPHHLAGYVTPAAAKATGLHPGTPVAYGGGDQPMQAIGNGILSPGSASITLGTSGQVFTPTALPVYDPCLRTHTFCHAPDNTWYVMGAVLNACLAINWFSEKILRTDDYRKVHELAAQATPGSQGLLFMPYLTGERTPHMNEKARGGFVGFTLRHSIQDMSRAVLEGLAFSMYEAIQPAYELSLHPEQILLSGGGVRSPLLRQILCDVFGQTMMISTVTEQAGLGAAMCATVATGECASLEEACSRYVSRELIPVEPNNAIRDVYMQQFELFRKLYQQNEPVFNQMTL